MQHQLAVLVLDVFEGSRAYNIIFGALTAGACLALAVPLLLWVLPGRQRWVFARSSDPRQFLQIGYGVACMSMAFADALCRFIPHRPLGMVHPVFFITTVALAVLIAPRLLALRKRNAPVRVREAMLPLSLALAMLIVFPATTVVQAFRV